jgi:hypothetical protein
MSARVTTGYGQIANSLKRNTPQYSEATNKNHIRTGRVLTLRITRRQLAVGACVTAFRQRRLHVLCSFARDPRFLIVREPAQQRRCCSMPAHHSNVTRHGMLDDIVIGQRVAAVCLAAACMDRWHGSGKGRWPLVVTSVTCAREREHTVAACVNAF